MFPLRIRTVEDTNGFPRYRGTRIATYLLVMLIGILMAGSVVVWGQTERSLARIRPPEGFQFSDVPEKYHPDTLFEKINGQAEFYLSAGFISLESQWYEAVDNANTIIELNLYDMGSMMNAFSVFSLQRREDAQIIGVTPFAYQTNNALYMVHGRYYVEILSGPPSDTPNPILIQLAEGFIRDTPVEKEDLRLLSVFPSENLVKGSTSMIAKDAFGFEPLDNVFTVTYEMGTGRSTAYISKRKSAEEARSLVRGLDEFFMQYGGRRINGGIAIDGAQMIEIMGNIEVMFSLGEYVAGVHEAPDQKQAEMVAISLVESLKKINGEKAY